MDQKREAFAAELRRLRALTGLSLAELARAAHVNRGYVGHVEHGQRWPSRSVAAALDDALDARGALLAAWEAADTQPALPSVGTLRRLVLFVKSYAERSPSSALSCGFHS